MLKFLVFQDGQPASEWPLRNVYLIGSDGSAMRGEIGFENGMIFCEKREIGTAALVLQHRVGELGELTLQTCLLPERDEPYLLNLELARHRLMLLLGKLEDWGEFELDSEHPVSKRVQRARGLFLEALCAQGNDSVRTDELAQQCLAAALDGSEELALTHAEELLARRKASGTFRHAIGCGISLEHTTDRVRNCIQGGFDFLQLPTPWRALAPEEGDYRWALTDRWVEWAAKSRLPLVAGPALAFDPVNLPDWLYIWEHDYETIRDLLYEHIERLMDRYQAAVSLWKVVSGLHVNSHFPFNFDQLMDITRMTCMLVKKKAPQAKAMIEIREPFGEYYASNPRSIPPMMYVELIVQSGIPFDGFAVHLPMGQARPGQYTRDLMQISNLLDQFSGYGKPVYLTVGAPSGPVTEMMIAAEDSRQPVDASSGFWRRPWSEVVQSHWLEAVLQIALSKPIVEAVAWQDLMDDPSMELPLSGLITENLQPKPALSRLATFRRNLAAPRPGETVGELEQASAGSGSPILNAPPPDAAPGGATATQGQPGESDRAD
ncbi:MAG: endo-1,4-beta-xylanase [Phycisphaeraceae bacterium]